MKEYPDTIKWSLSRDAACGIKAYLRPCQDSIIDVDNTIEYPISKLCRTRNEKVFICDDDIAFLDEICELIRSFGYDTVACESTYDLRKEIYAADSGCILLDVRMPDEDGLSAFKVLSNNSPNLPIIFISGINDIDAAVCAMRDGAFDFIKKPVNELHLQNSLIKAISRSRMNFCQNNSNIYINKLLNALTRTELHVANLIAKGYPTKLIASEMGRSENTIKIHRHRILNKLKVSSAASIANIINISKNDL